MDREVGASPNRIVSYALVEAGLVCRDHPIIPVVVYPLHGHHMRRSRSPRGTAAYTFCESNRGGFSGGPPPPPFYFFHFLLALLIFIPLPPSLFLPLRFDKRKSHPKSDRTLAGARGTTKKRKKNHSKGNSLMPMRVVLFDRLYIYVPRKSLLRNFRSVFFFFFIYLLQSLARQHRSFMIYRDFFFAFVCVYYDCTLVARGCMNEGILDQVVIALLIPCLDHRRASFMTGKAGSGFSLIFTRNILVPHH